mmetsp:Transcript_32120/g.39833  ORF Transcript_32120/g.39833 Transcript_32120/m.39833 type:complete len:335 (-) Transcript_32120:156-1160(-)
MGEGGGGSGIGKIISGHIDGLHGGNGSGSGGSNTLLKGTHIGGEGGLVADSGGDTAEQGRHLRASLGETEDVVDEKKHILVLLITEVLGDGETSEADTGSGTRGLVHLTVHKGGLGAGAIGLDDTGLDHFVVKIVALTGALADTGEHGETTVKFGDVVDKLHDQDSLTDTGTTEETNLTTSGVRAKEVDNLNTRNEQLLTRALLLEGWGISVDRQVLLGTDGTALVDGLTNDIDNSAESLGANRHLNGATSVLHGLATDETLRGVEGNRTHVVATQVLGDFEDETVLGALDLKGVENRRKLTLELHIDDGANNLGNLARGSAKCALASKSGEHL